MIHCAVVLLLLFFIQYNIVGIESVPVHPLDGLTPEEYIAIGTILESNGKKLNTTRFSQISLQEPDKAFVKSWVKGDTFPRIAVAYIKEGPESYKAIVDLNEKSIVSFEVASGEGMIILEEIFGAMDVALASSEMLAGLALRNLTADDVYCLPLTAGTYGDADEVGRRLMKVPCFVLPTSSNWFAKPIEGLFAFVDLNTNEVLEVVDTGAITVNVDEFGYTPVELEALFGDLRGPTFETIEYSTTRNENIGIDGSEVTWDIWKFHYRVDKRPALILSQIEVLDQDTWRSVLYSAMLSEVFVPYMDPDAAWYWRTYMDSGEYGFGGNMYPLIPGVDCPLSATYLGTTNHDDYGNPFGVPGTICLFERSIGDPLWRHFEVFAQTPEPQPAEGRPATELVIRYVATVGNYDYLMDYIFQQDGAMRISIGATGIDATKGGDSSTLKDPTAANETRHGSLIAPNLLAPFHDHFFNFRLDFDIDGEENDFRKARIAPMNMSNIDIPRTSMWGVVFEDVENEIDARTKVNPQTPHSYFFVNKNKESGVGYAPGYELMPMGSYAYNLMDAVNDPPVKRNDYIEYQLFVTPYDAKQMYAGGEYAVQSTGNDTLYEWSNENRSIVNQDIVAWYTAGFHHIPRMEDYPVMPMHWATFKIRPFNFFTHNPAITLKPKTVDVQSSMTCPNTTTPTNTNTTSDSFQFVPFPVGSITLFFAFLIWNVAV